MLVLSLPSRAVPHALARMIAAASMSQSTPSGGSGVLSHAESSARHPSEALDELPVRRRIEDLPKLASSGATLETDGTDDAEDDADGDRLVFVGGIPYDVMEAELATAFESWGDVRRVRLVRHHKAKPTGEHKGYGFITYATEAQASALRAMGTITLGEHSIHVSKAVYGAAKTQTSRDEREQSHRTRASKQSSQPPASTPRPSAAPRAPVDAPLSANPPSRGTSASWSTRGAPPSTPPSAPPHEYWTYRRQLEYNAAFNAALAEYYYARNIVPLPLVPWSTHSTMFPTHVSGGWTPGVRVGLGPSGWAPGAPTPPHSPRGRYSERRVFVGGLPRSVTDDTLGWFFSRWGAVEEANVVRDPLTGASRRFGFVAFARAESAATVKSLGTVAFSDTVAFNVADALHHGHATRSSTSATTRDDPDSRAAPSIPAAVHPEGVEDVARSASALAPGSGTEAETANANDAPEDVRADRSAAGERSRAKIPSVVSTSPTSVFHARTRSDTSASDSGSATSGSSLASGAASPRLAMRTHEMSLAHLAPLVADGGEGLRRVMGSTRTRVRLIPRRGTSRRTLVEVRGVLDDVERAWSEIRVACRPASPRSCGAGVVHADAVEGDGDVAAELAELEEGSILYRTSSRTSSTELDDDGPASPVRRALGRLSVRSSSGEERGLRSAPLDASPSFASVAAGRRARSNPRVVSVHGLAANADADDLHDFFSDFGTVLNVEASMGIPGVSSSLALVEFADERDAFAVRARREFFFDGRIIELGAAEERRPPTPATAW